MPEVIVVRNPPALPRRQGGVALMVLITLAALGGMAFYLSEFNAKVGSSVRTESIAQTRSALREARDALLGASVSDIANGTSRERPGQLPWPDRAENNSPAYDGWSDCVTSGFNVSHLIGRFPFRGEINCVGIASAIELGSRFVDGTGEPLWYAVSRNLLNTDSDPTEGGTQLWPINPDIVTNLPSNMGWNWLRVCDTRGRLVSDRVAAVIIAPGAALENQNRKTVATQGGGYQLPGPQEYLDSFAVVDTDGTPRPVRNHDSDDGPDSLGLAGVGQCREKGTAGEEFILPVGLAADERATFNDELVYITIDEIVEAVQLRAMNTIANALNKHRAEVEDVMKAASPSARGRLPWLSPFGSAEQPANDADNLSVLTEGKVGTYDSAAQTLTAASGSITFDASMVGAAIRNLDDGSTAVIRSVDEASGSITISDVVGGLDNTFAPDDTFQIPVFRSDFYGGTTEGQIPFGAIQEVVDEETKTVEIVTVVEDVVSDFRSEWDLDMTEDGALFDQASITNGSPALAASHRTFAMSSERTGPVQIRNHPGSQDSGVCRYLAPRDIRCQGVFYRTPLLSLVADVDSAFELKAGTVTDAADTDQSPFDFSEWGVGPGSIVRNMGQPASGATPSQGIVNAVSVGGESDRLSVVGLTGGTTNQFSVGDLIDILPAGREIIGTATGGSTSVLVDVTPGVNFIDAQITEGDIVTDGSGAYAYITSVSSGGDTLTLGGWAGTGVVDFSGGAVAYTIYSGHVAQRRMVFDWYLVDQNPADKELTNDRD